MSNSFANRPASRRTFMMTGRVWRAQPLNNVRVHRRVRSDPCPHCTFVPWWKIICHLPPAYRHIELLREKGEACLSFITRTTLYVTRQTEALSSRTLKFSTIRSIGAHCDIAAMISALDQIFPEAPNSTKSSAISEDASSADNLLPT